MRRSVRMPQMKAKTVPINPILVPRPSAPQPPTPKVRPALAVKKSTDPPVDTPSVLIAAGEHTNAEKDDDDSSSTASFSSVHASASDESQISSATRVRPPPAANSVTCPESEDWEALDDDTFQAGKGRCTNFDELCVSLHLQVPSAETWLDAFCQFAEQLPFAAAVADMTVAGAAMTRVTARFATLTGYSRQEAEGQNCRFLQGEKTESVAIRKIGDAIRNERPVQLRITNYRKSGDPFANVLTLLPVHDSLGEYRYMIALQLDGASATSEQLDLVSELLLRIPRVFDSACQPYAYTRNAVPEGKEQWRNSIVRFTKMMWTMDLEATLHGFVIERRAAQAFLAYADATQAEDLLASIGNVSAAFRLLVAIRKLERSRDDGSTTDERAVAVTRDLFEKFKELHAGDKVMGGEYGEKVRGWKPDPEMELAVTSLDSSTWKTKVAAVDATADEEQIQLWSRHAVLPSSEEAYEGQGGFAIQLRRTRVHLLTRMATEVSAKILRDEGKRFESFISSEASTPLVAELIGSEFGNEMLSQQSRISRRTGLSRQSLLWDEYRPPPDSEGWLHALASVGEVLPACIVISDMSIPGNPMVYVNPEFCHVTGYSKGEATGRNCRFLQGPKTEPESVAIIQDSLRRGADCYVRITNYRKSGEPFQNLLTLRPVQDSNGVLRFCFGVQFEVTRSRSGTEAMLTRVGRLIELLPKELPTEEGLPAAGPTLDRKLLPVEETGSVLDKLMSVIDWGQTPSKTPPVFR